MITIYTKTASVRAAIYESSDSEVVKTEKTDTTDEGEQIVKSDTNIVFTADNLPFELTESDIELLIPKVSLQAEPLI